MQNRGKSKISRTEFCVFLVILKELSHFLLVNRKPLWYNVRVPCGSRI